LMAQRVGRASAGGIGKLPTERTVEGEPLTHGWRCKAAS
jgi:hypothetical protein